MQFLYRGISILLHQKNKGQLLPKAFEQFRYQFHWGEFNWDSGVTWGASEVNAVIRHQLDQSGFPTSGISTTPYFERAKYYATSGGKDKGGYIYKIDRALLASHAVREYVVSEFVREPSIPEDDEVILVSNDFAALPEAVIVELITV